jgi:hypothetical protein
MSYSPTPGMGQAMTPGPGEEHPPLPPEYLVRRPRRLRSHPALRRLVRETQLTRDDLVLPLFVVEGRGVRSPVASMPGVFRESIDRLAETCREVQGLGIPAVILFGVTEKKDPEGRHAWLPEGLVQRAVEKIAVEAPDLLRMVDLCFCEYTDHGHCAYELERKLNDGRHVVVGVNTALEGNDEPPPDILRIGPEVEELQCKRLAQVRADRDDESVRGALDAVRTAAADPTVNVMPSLIAAVDVYATEGEVMDALADVFGRYVETPVL